MNMVGKVDTVLIQKVYQISGLGLGIGDDEVTYSSSSYGTCGFSPDPTAPGYVPYADLTQDEVLGWIWADGVDKDATETSLQANIDLQINPVTAAGVPW